MFIQTRGSSHLPICAMLPLCALAAVARGSRMRLQKSGGGRRSGVGKVISPGGLLRNPINRVFADASPLRLPLNQRMTARRLGIEIPWPMRSARARLCMHQ